MSARHSDRFHRMSAIHDVGTVVLGTYMYM